ncbi:MAG: YfhO family protein [Oscillospiraceae bacterium]|nr:YfhO family protein [Oscillospiraceae bacterium]
MRRSNRRLARRPLSERREPYLAVFLLSFVMLLLVILPIIIFTKGYLIYYGDFNSQQLPFYYHAHEMVRSGSFGWDWMTDLGSNFIGSYSFYLLGSPFFWLTVPFPQEWTLYLMPYLLALKHAFAALTAYAYIRRFVRSRQASVIGALLYSFSGFQLYNIFFNHFQDVTAFFPLLLIAMEQRVNENRRGVFTLTVAFMGILNYYFFTGQAVFAVLYFILRCPAKDFRADVRKFFGLALEAVIGTMIACFMLLPAALAVLGNYRVSTKMWGLDMVAYSDRTRIWHIIESFFMPPDLPARPNLFRTDFGKWSSIGGYLPMFSMAGVMAFMAQKRKHWATRLVAVCTVCAFIPILNSAFYMLNSSYYARWFYMPILIMAMMTAYALDNPQIRWRGSFKICALMLGGFGLISLLPRKDDEGKIVWFDFAKYSWYFWLMLGLTAVLLYLGMMVLMMRKRGSGFYRMAILMTAFSCLCTAFGMVYFGIGLGSYPTAFVNAALTGGPEISASDTDEQFWRVDISKDYDNYPMFWGYSNMRCFHSIVPPSLMEFYSTIGLQRDVASRPDPKNYPLRALFNVRYYLDKADGEKTDGYTYELKDMPGFTYLKKDNGFYIYENDCYIPMGLAYDYYISEPDMDPLGSVTKQKNLLQALVLSKEQIAAYKDIIEELPASSKAGIKDSYYVDYCKERAAQTCEKFTYDSYGFNASITLEQPKLVFFSIPFEDGWTAEVNGQTVPVERVSYGFMAVRCEAGSNQITFRYETPGLRTGASVSLCGIGALALYLLWMMIRERGVRPKQAARKYCYDYNGMNEIYEQALYAAHAAVKHPRQTAERRRRYETEPEYEPEAEYEPESAYDSEPEYDPEYESAPEEANEDDI